MITENTKQEEKKELTKEEIAEQERKNAIICAPELTKENIISADDLQRERVDVLEWKGHVFVKTMTGAERDSFEQRVHDQRANNKINVEGIRIKRYAGCHVQ